MAAHTYFTNNNKTKWCVAMGLNLGLKRCPWNVSNNKLTLFLCEIFLFVRSVVRWFIFYGLKYKRTHKHALTHPTAHSSTRRRAIKCYPICSLFFYRHTNAQEKISISFDAWRWNVQRQTVANVFKYACSLQCTHTRAHYSNNINIVREHICARNERSACVWVSECVNSPFFIHSFNSLSLFLPVHSLTIPLNLWG